MLRVFREFLWRGVRAGLPIQPRLDQRRGEARIANLVFIAGSWAPGADNAKQKTRFPKQERPAIACRASIKRPAVLQNAFPLLSVFAVGWFRLRRHGFVALAIPNVVLIGANIPRRFYE